MCQELLCEMRAQRGTRPNSTSLHHQGNGRIISDYTGSRRGETRGISQTVTCGRKGGHWGFSAWTPHRRWPKEGASTAFLFREEASPVELRVKQGRPGELGDSTRGETWEDLITTTLSCELCRRRGLTRVLVGLCAWVQNWVLKASRGLSRSQVRCCQDMPGMPRNMSLLFVYVQTSPALPEINLWIVLLSSLSLINLAFNCCPGLCIYRT